MRSSKQVIDGAVAVCAATAPRTGRISPNADGSFRMLAADCAIRGYVTAAGMALGLVAAWAALVRLAA